MKNKIVIGMGGFGRNILIKYKRTYVEAEELTLLSFESEDENKERFTDEITCKIYSEIEQFRDVFSASEKIVIVLATRSERTIKALMHLVDIIKGVNSKCELNIITLKPFKFELKPNLSYINDYKKWIDDVKAEVVEYENDSLITNPNINRKTSTQEALSIMDNDILAEIKRKVM